MEYYSFNKYLQDKYGCRVQRLSLNAGFTCPNRDGTLSDEGCIFCNEEGFAAFSSKNTPSLQDQINTSIEFAEKRYKAKKFIVYFQTGSSTYASLNELRETYEIIRKYPDVVGLYISTRPDCIDDEKLDLLELYARDYEVWVEYGIQTVHEKTLMAINRKHTFIQAEDAIKRTDARDIKVGAHIILGLPGESAGDMLKTAEVISGLPVAGVKFHLFHILKGTKAEKLYNEGKVDLLDREEYVNIVGDFIERLGRKCVILRIISGADKQVLVAPLWMNDKQSIIRAVEER